MAEKNPVKERPTEEEGHEFAKALYNYIWQKFRVTLTADEAYIPSVHTDNFQDIVAKAVISEQLLTRQFLKSIFIHKKAFMFDSDVAFILCKVVCDCSPKWDFFKKLLRYSALIAEFFIYRTEYSTPLQLIRGPLIWNAIFKKYFAKDFYSKNGWQGLTDYSQRYVDVFSILEPVVDRMGKYPYVNVYTDNYLDFPDDPNMPMTHGGDVIIELTATFKNVDSYFTFKARPGKPSRNRKESAIFEGSEDESSSGSASHSSSSSSYQSSKDPLGDSGILSTMLEHLGQASTSSTAAGSSEQSGESASISKEELTEDKVKDLSSAELPEETESRKRPLLTDASDSDGPTKAKQPKPSDSPDGKGQ